MAVASATELQPVSKMTVELQRLLQRASDVKPETTVDPPLPIEELNEDVSRVHDEFDDLYDQAYRFNAIESAARQIFYSLIGSTDIQDPAFVQVWNLLDLLLLCGDKGKCTPELVCWLIEELLDSQTTHGCRTVFDYLESRRERLAQKDFHKKNLVFLRSCNELLRRLSRAEDAIFCGRVFFFLFQTFPLGDKSSVNLRGEFHVENTTKFEVPDNHTEQNGEKMDVDVEHGETAADTVKAETPQPSSKPTSKAIPIKAPSKKAEEEVLSYSDLYPIFWRLQQDFSDPTRLFTSDNFEAFQKGLANTIAKFKKTPTFAQTKAGEDGKRGTKRKVDANVANGESSGEVSEFSVDNYNPKYLTSRRLFDLELSDQAFQRHILVQSLILIDFLLSLTDKAKKRLAVLETANKSMLYSFTLGAEDAKWTTATRSTITNYLSATHEGRLFNRMVETVLARDKNWIRWKVESCPSIVRDPVSTESEMEARRGAQSSTRVRRVPEKRVGAMDLSFLVEGSGRGIEALKDPARYTVPNVDQLLDAIKTDELDMEMAMDDEEKSGLENAIANKRWRILRQTKADKLELLDKVEPGRDLDRVFKAPLASEGEEDDDDAIAGNESLDQVHVKPQAEEGLEGETVIETNGTGMAEAETMVDVS